MAFTRILQWLGNTLVIMAGLMVATALVSLFLADAVSSIRLSIAAVATAAVGAILVLATLGTPARETNYEALVFLVLFWLVVPVLGALPFRFLDGSDTWLLAWFEAVSAFTTTGASTFAPEDVPQALLVWRSLLQAFGGVVAATFAVVILASLNLAGTGVHRSMLFTLRKGELFERLVTIGRAIAGIYALISAVGFVVMSALGTRPFDAFCLALSGTATGGAGTRSLPLAEYVPFPAAVALAAICLLGAASVAAHWDVLRVRTLGEVRHFFRNVEHRALIGIFIGLSVVGFAYTGFRHFGTVTLEAAFLVSGAGYDYTVIGLELLPPALLIMVALVGGSALSTAGGLKLMRVLLLFRHLRVDVERLSHPSRIKPVLFRGLPIADSAFLSVWMYFFGYTLVFGLGTVLLGISGLPFDVAVPASAGSLANIGPLLDTNMVLTGWADFTPPQLVFCALLMLAGRVEVLAILAVVSPRVWSR